MNIEQHVTSLEISKRLKELGVKQESCFYWCSFDPRGKTDWRGPYMKTDVGLTYSGTHYFDSNDAIGGMISAFLASELGELLPKQQMQFGFDETIWWIKYEGRFETLTENMSEANSRGKMLIYLLEQKIITL